MAAKQPKEYLFKWQATNRKGTRITGEMTSVSETAVKASLRNQGLIPTRVSRKSSFGSGQGQRIKPVDISVFTRQLSTMLGAGVPLVQALDIMGRSHAKASMRRLVSDIKNEVTAGTSLHNALRKHPAYFDNLYINLVEAGEQAGALESLLDKLAMYKEKTESLKSKIRNAMVYPAILMLVAISVTVFLLIFAVPAFQGLFQSAGADLPAITQGVVALSEFLLEYGLILLGVLILIPIIFGYIHRRSPPLQMMTDRLKLRLPVFGDVFQKAAVARFSRTLATMFSSGVPLIETLRSVARATGNRVYEKGILTMREQVATGVQLQLAMSQTGLFPSMATQMIAIGEEAGSVDHMANKVADFYEEDVDNAIERLKSMLEPLVIVVMGVIVVFLLAAIYIPIFKIGMAF